MAYSVTKLAKVANVSVRTLRWYDSIGLLPPSYYGSNGYRYYEEEQLLLLQQILFFRELGFELKRIKAIVGKSDFNKIAALQSHRKVLEQSLERTKKLIRTIDNTINHLKGTRKMKEPALFSGFSKKKQAEYERQIVERFGEVHVKESKQNAKSWTKAQEESFKQDFDAICKELAHLIEEKYKPGAQKVQDVIRKHYNWLKRAWTPTKETYAAHGRFIADSELAKAYRAYHPQLPEFIAEAIQLFAESEL